MIQRFVDKIKKLENEKSRLINEAKGMIIELLRPKPPVEAIFPYFRLNLFYLCFLFSV